MEHKTKRAGGGALGGLRANYDTYLTPDRPQAPAQPDLLTRLRSEVPVFRDYLPLALRIREALHAALPDVGRYGLEGRPSGKVSQDRRAAAVLVLARRSEYKAEVARSPS